MAWVVRSCVRLCTFNHVTRKPILCGRPFLKYNQAFHESKSRFAKKEPRVSLRKAVIAVCCFGIGGGVYGYVTAAVPERKERILGSKVIEHSESAVIPDIPDIQPSRQIDGPFAATDFHLTLYQYQTCPFCCKVRAFLGYHGIPYDVVEVNPVLRQQLSFSKYKKVPVLIAHDEKSNKKYQLNDSSVIISILGTYLMDIKGGLEKVLPFYVPVVYANVEGIEITEVTNKYFLMYGEKYDSRTFEDVSRERTWRRWADSELVHILSPNIYRTYNEAKQAFNYFSEVGEWEKNFSFFERQMVIYVGATAMYFIGKKLKKKYSLKDDVRQSLYDACNTLVDGIGPDAKFLGGESPNIADLEIYGLFSSIEGCSAFTDALSHTNIGSWYDRVKSAVQQHKGYNSLITSKP